VPFAGNRAAEITCLIYCPISGLLTAAAAAVPAAASRVPARSAGIPPAIIASVYRPVGGARRGVWTGIRFASAVRLLNWGFAAISEHGKPGTAAG
jgi:hypothetical protein